MLSARAKEVVEQATPSRKVSLVIFVHPGARVASVARIKDLRQRSKRLDVLYREIKEPVLATVSEYASMGMRVVDGLEGTPQVIVSAPAKAWLKLIGEHASVFDDPNVEVLANEHDWVAL